LTKKWLGDFSGDFSWSLGDFSTKTSGHPDDRSQQHPSAVQPNVSRSLFYQPNEAIYSRRKTTQRYSINAVAVINYHRSKIAMYPYYGNLKKSAGEILLYGQV
jgi:hypothetical protein